jgi:glucuronoarabinoxylan endo-1,4-beta-xylanase
MSRIIILKRAAALSISAALAVSLVALSPQVQAAHASSGVTIEIDPSLTYQRIDGFGASMVDQVAGESGLPYNLESLDAAHRSQVEDLLFSPTSGIGLNMLRLELGAGETYPNGSTPVPDFTIEPSAPASPSSTPSYVWDSNADGQVQIAKDAVARGVSTIYADAWSAPAFMKTSNNVYGGNLCGLSSCASGDWTLAYANYLAKYVQDYASDGVTLNYVSPFNEPYSTTDYQSMTANPAQLATFVATLGSTFATDGLATKVASSDVGSANEADWYQQAIEANSAAAAAQSVATFHSYAGTPAAMPSAALVGKDSWQSEFTCVGDKWNTAYSTGDCDGQHWAQTIYTAMNNGVSAYLGWTGAWSHTDNEDLIRITGSSTYQVSSRVWAMGNYAKYVHAGATRIEAASSSNSILSTAYKNPDGSYVAVVSNTSGSPQTLNLTGLNGGSVTPVLTDDTTNLVAQSPVSVGSAGVSLTIPASSTVTYVYSGASAGTPLSYKIASVNSGSLLSIDSSSLADGATLWQWHDVGVPAQWWYLTPVGSGYYKIVSRLSGKAVTIDPPLSTDGSPATQRTWAATDAQEWKILSVINGEVILMNKASGKVLSIDGSSMSDGAIAHQWHWLNSTAQLWNLTPTS